jgi:hypothetical protein
MQHSLRSTLGFGGVLGINDFERHLGTRINAAMWAPTRAGDDPCQGRCRRRRPVASGRGLRHPFDFHQGCALTVRA